MTVESSRCNFPTMTLSDYLTSRHLSWHAASLALGISYGSIHRLKKGGRPSVATAAKIEAWSNGAVRATELLGLPSR